MKCLQCGTENHGKSGCKDSDECCKNKECNLPLSLSHITDELRRDLLALAYHYWPITPDLCARMSVGGEWSLGIKGTSIVFDTDDLIRVWAKYMDLDLQATCRERDELREKLAALQG